MARVPPQTKLSPKNKRKKTDTKVSYYNVVVFPDSNTIDFNASIKFYLKKTVGNALVLQFGKRNYTNLSPFR